MSPSTAAAAFPEAALRPHRRRNVRAGKGGAAAAVLRATGDIFIPENLARHVEFISGLTELWARDVAGGGARQLDGAGASRFGGMNVRCSRGSMCVTFHSLICAPAMWSWKA